MKREITVVWVTNRDMKVVKIERGNEYKMYDITKRRLDRVMRIISGKPLTIGMYQNGFTAVWCKNGYNFALVFWGN